MSTTIVNASSQMLALGIDDVSAKPPVFEPRALPTHLPKFFLFAADGPAYDVLVGGAARQRIYGADTFDPLKEFFNHQTLICQEVNAAANQHIIRRVIPEDAPAPANVRIYADVLPVKLDEFERESDGSFKLDAQGKRVVKTPLAIDGFRVKYVAEHIALGADGEDMFGQATEKAGDQTDEITRTQSTRYPIMDVAASFQGETGNLCGFRLWAPTQRSTDPLKEKLITKEGFYPFRLAMVKRADAQSNPRVVVTEEGDQYVTVAFKNKAIDRELGRDVAIEKRFVKEWQDLRPVDRTPPRFAGLGRFHLYRGSVDKLVKQFYEAEFMHTLPEFSDFDGSANEEHRFNFISGVSSYGVPYSAFELVPTIDGGIRFTENTTISPTGGGNGTMTAEVFDKLVAAEMLQYADDNSRLMSDALHPESNVYDSGFGMETKKALASMIAIRKDTWVALSTTIAGEPALSASEDSSRAVMLKAYVNLFPESEFYGTSVCRASIIGRSGVMVGSVYEERVPVTIEIASKIAEFMGGSNGRWVPAKAIDQGDNRKFTKMSDFNETFTGARVRNKDWANGLTWVEAYDLDSVYIPAWRTVYDDDSSVLTGLVTVLASVALTKVGARVHREFSGDQKLTRPQLKERVENRFRALVEDGNLYDNRFVIIPEVIFTADDVQRGYSWHLEVTLGAPGMKTVQVFTIKSARIEDVQAA